MDKLENFKLENVPQHLIIFTVTDPISFEMERIYLIEDYPEFNLYTVVHGYHCSCYDFIDAEWEAIAYTREELEKLMKVWEGGCDALEKKIAKLVLEYF